MPLLAGLRGRLTEPDYIVPVDLRERFGDQGALPAFQRLISHFGRLLQCWPALVEAARDLRARDIRPADRP